MGSGFCGKRMNYKSLPLEKKSKKEEGFASKTQIITVDLNCAYLIVFMDHEDIFLRACYSPQGLYSSHPYRAVTTFYAPSVSSLGG